MAQVTAQLAAANNNLSHVDLTYDDVTLACISLSWTNPTGHWTFTLSKGGGNTIVRTLNPGDAGTVNFPNNWNWARLKGQSPNFTFSDNWTAA